MSLIRLNPNPSRTQLATFGVAWVTVLGACGAVLWCKGRPVAASGLWALAAAAPLLGLASARVWRALYLGLSYATFPIGYVVSHVVLAAIYYLVLSPIGLLLRLSGHDPLARRFDPAADSYWKPHGAAPSAESYFRQI
jgi:hypothetical protein